MLKVFRDSMKYLAWILWAVIAVFILFVFVDFGGSMPGAQPNRSAATVGDQSVSYRELEREHRNLEEDMRSRLGDQYTPELAEQLQLPMQALNRIIDRKVMLAEAERLKLTVSDQELQKYILDLPVFKNGDKFVGQEAYDRFLRRLNYTPDTFEAEIRNQLLVERLVATLESSLAVSDQAVEKRYREQAERASIRYVALPGTTLRAEAKPTPEELEAYFEAHREDLRIPEERTADYLLVDTRKVRETLEVGDEAIATYFSEHKAEYFEQEQVQARHILIGTSERTPAEAEALTLELLERIRGGEDFAVIARELSDDPGSKTRGGDLGYFGRGRMVAPFETAAFDAAVGDMVGPVQSQFGYHIIEVQDHKAEHQRPLEEVRDLISNRLASDLAATRAEEIVRQLHDQLIGETPRTMAELAEENEAVETGKTRPFRAEGSILPLGNAPALNPQAFGLEVGGITEPAQAGRGWVVLQLAEILPEHLPEYNEVQGQVRRNVVEEQAAELAVQRLIAAQAEAEGADDLLAAVAEAVGQTVVDSPLFGQGGTIPQLGRATELVKAVFASEEGDYGKPVVQNGKAILYQVSQRHHFSSEELESRRSQLRQQMVNEQLQSVLGALVNRRKDELGVEYDRGLLEDLNILGEPQQG
ncbi:MAG: SurA N-terminal domain-containing protein [Thermoanaerobaculia bacterium]|nr:SurA N-terminal domain-containing protein [Thermoanaerobaculia bacterium]